MQGFTIIKKDQASIYYKDGLGTKYLLFGPRMRKSRLVTAISLE